MDLIERFQYIMKLNQMNASTFADEIGIQRSSLSHVLSGRNKPGLDFIQKVLKRFPKVDAAWLINGTTSGVNKLVVPRENEEITEPENESVREDGPKTDRREDESSVKGITKILVFYSDNTFEEFKPRS